MHWTTLADSEIFATNAPPVGQVEQQIEEIVTGRARLVVTRGLDGRAVISRVISPVPKDYLKPEWQPGMVYRE